MRTIRYRNLNSLPSSYVLKCGFLILLVFVFLSGMSQSFPIPAEGAEWNNADSQGTTYYANRVVSKGDTIIESKVFSKLYHTWSAVYFQTGVCDFEYSSGPSQRNMYYGAIRTDENQKVYYIYPEEDTSRLIYDFEVNPGDSIKLDGFDLEYFAHVLEVDTLYLSTSPRKRITLRGMYGFHDEWIEGIGSIYGVLATFMRPREKYDSELTCYQEFGERIYPESSNCDRCNIVTQAIVHSIDESVTVYPNPIINRSVLKWSISSKPEQLNVYDLTGRIIYSKSIGNANSSYIDRSNLEKGVLILEIIDNKGKKFKRQINVL